MKGIDSSLVEDFIINGLKEDVGVGDHTGNACIDPDKRSTAQLIVKDIGVIAGIELAEAIFKHLDPTTEFETLLQDGSLEEDDDIAFKVSCNAKALLIAERLALNMMQRMSGIATLSARFALEIEDLPVTILDTRKTTPLIRAFEKWAVRIGGCTNYRDGLYDWVMIKDNHIDACGGITEALNRVEAYQKFHNLDLGVTIEVRNLVELYKVLEIGKVTRIMLDNFELPLLKEAILIINNRFETEASGGINLRTVRKIAKTGVNFISIGALTHSAGSLDLSLKIIL